MDQLSNYQVAEEEKEDCDFDWDHVECGCEVIPEEDHDAVLHVVHRVERVLVVDATAAKHVVEAALRFWKLNDKLKILFVKRVET